MSLLEEINGMLEQDSLDFLYLKSYNVLEDEIIDEGRWDLRHRAVITNGAEHVAVEYSVGATEYQDDTEINGEAYEVYPKQVVVLKYVKLNTLDLS